VGNYPFFLFVFFFFFCVLYWFAVCLIDWLIVYLLLACNFYFLFFFLSVAAVLVVEMGRKGGILLRSLKTGGVEE
jgi:hypothetical protein